MSKHIHIYVGTRDAATSRHAEYVIKVTWDPVRLGGETRSPSFYKFDHNPNMNEIHYRLESQGYFAREIKAIILHSKK